ncbi:MAG: methyltransferase domain-containing protein [Methanobacteriota archaeon]|nr:MAG: methyltransferase domain-containing protein [Euryarchaeota archaeon]
MSDRIEEVRNAYRKISSSYQSKKNHPWNELLEALPLLSEQKSGILIDVGGGNGRNIQLLNRSLTVVLDLSEDLLRNFAADNGLNQRVLGALPFLPFRDGCSNETISIAVLHHLPDQFTRIEAMRDLRRITCEKGKIVFTVWRRWRRGHREKLIERIKKEEPIDDLVDHLRPWKDSSGKTLAHRFYHYYTFRELLEETSAAGTQIVKWSRMGGKHNDSNFLVFIS